jgi:hypothetical protein
MAAARRVQVAGVGKTRTEELRKKRVGIKKVHPPSMAPSSAIAEVRVVLQLIAISIERTACWQSDRWQRPCHLGQVKALDYRHLIARVSISGLCVIVAVIAVTGSTLRSQSTLQWIVIYTGDSSFSFASLIFFSLCFRFFSAFHFKWSAFSFLNCSSSLMLARCLLRDIELESESESDLLLAQPLNTF